MGVEDSDLNLLMAYAFEKIQPLSDTQKKTCGCIRDQLILQV